MMLPRFLEFYLFMENLITKQKKNSIEKNYLKIFNKNKTHKMFTSIHFYIERMTSND